MTTLEDQTVQLPRIGELEDWFDAHGITWRLEQIPLDQVDHLAGLANQARLSPLDEQVVDRYTADMEAGAVFPPIVVRRERRKLVPVGGNHRCAAARKADVGSLAGYIVEGLTDELVHLLAIEDNRRHGLPLSDDERLFHAVQIVNAGRTVVDAAAICGLPAHKLGRQLDARRGGERAVRLDADGWAALSTTAKARIVSIRDDSAFARVVALAASAAIPAIELADVVGRVNKGTPEQAAELLDALESDAGLRTPRAGGHPVSKMRAPATRLLHDLEGICGYDPKAVAGDCVSAEQRARLAKQVKATARRLMAVEKELWA